MSVVATGDTAKTIHMTIRFQNRIQMTLLGKSQGYGHTSYANPSSLGWGGHKVILCRRGFGTYSSMRRIAIATLLPHPDERPLCWRCCTLGERRGKSLKEPVGPRMPLILCFCSLDPTWAVFQSLVVCNFMCAAPGSNGATGQDENSKTMRQTNLFLL